jgi:transposase
MRGTSARRTSPGNLNSSISVETAPEGEDLACEDWSKDEQKTRRTHSAAFLGENQLLSRAADVFGGEQATAEPAIDLKALHAKIGQLALENDFLEGALIKAGMLSAKR